MLDHIVFLLLATPIFGCASTGGACNSDDDEYSNTPRFVMRVSPPLSWTSPANNDPAFDLIMAGTVTVRLAGGAATSLDQATQNAQQDIQDAFEKALRSVSPTFNPNDLSLNLDDVQGSSINVFQPTPYSVQTITDESGGIIAGPFPAGIVEVSAVTKICNKTCIGPGTASAGPSAMPATTCPTPEGMCCTQFPTDALACENINQYSEFAQEMTLVVKTGPLLSGTQWREVADSLFKTLNQRRNVYFTKDIEMYPN